MSISPRQISRVLNLTFKVTGLKGQIEGVDMLIKGINLAIRAIITLRIALAALESSHPYIKAFSLILAGITALSMTGDLGRLMDTSGAR